MKVLTLVERGGGARSLHIEKLTAAAIGNFLLANASRRSVLMTDDAPSFLRPGLRFRRHERINHSMGEYVRGDVGTNTVEGFFSIFKRGMKGVYQHCGEQHLQRYLHEFDFRYSNRIALGVDDAARTTRAIKGAVGKRLMYRETGRRTSA